MMKIESVFVASDLSDASEEAIRIGHRWAELFEARLSVGFVLPKLVGSNPFFPQAAQLDTADLLEAERKAGDHLAERVRELTGRGPGASEIIVRTGSPVAGILDAASAAKADLVVVGPDANDATVAERIARLATCPVLVARRAAERGGIVAGTDLSDPSFGAVRAALDVARKLGVAATIVHAVETPPSAFEKIWSFLGQKPPAVENKVPAVRARIQGWLSDAGASGEVVVVEGDAANALVGLVTSRATELLVIGTRGWTSDANLPLGSVAEVVVRNAPCSVLVVRL